MANSLNPIPLATGESQKYYPVSDLAVVQKLAAWQDAKFGLLMHWGAYCQWGVVESWSICAEDEDWCQRRIDNYNQYVAEYEKLAETFNPIMFDPDKWAQAAYDAGMKYVVFTTKHHDGFCMFATDTKDYGIASHKSPFCDNSKADVTKEIFNAFRKKNFMTGVYFSNPDWHSDDYWCKNFPNPDRNPNYDINKYPERWERFVRFTHKQIDELMTNYGKIDIIWLDGGWVQKEFDCKPVNFKEVNPQNQDIRISEITEKARKKTTRVYCGRSSRGRSVSKLPHSRKQDT